MHNVISFSGGRTSAYLVHLMEQKRKAGEIDNVHYVFMDTGAEHPKTYEFIRNCVEHFGIDLVCLRVNINPTLGEANGYDVVQLSACKPDLQPWRDMSQKYGTPHVHGAFCTQFMKTRPYYKYCDDQFGKDNYISWLGIRVDEGNRLKQKDGMRYLAEISPMEKNDILGWWKQQDFDLEIESEWLGNCVFCLKKGTNRIELARRSEPRMAMSFDAMLKNPENRVAEGKKAPNEYIFRNTMSLETIEKSYEGVSTEQLMSGMRMQSGSCAESCEVFGCQGDLFDEL